MNKEALIDKFQDDLVKLCNEFASNPEIEPYTSYHVMLELLAQLSANAIFSAISDKKLRYKTVKTLANEIITRIGQQEQALKVN